MQYCFFFFLIITNHYFLLWQSSDIFFVNDYGTFLQTMPISKLFQSKFKLNQKFFDHLFLLSKMTYTICKKLHPNLVNELTISIY